MALSRSLCEITVEDCTGDDNSSRNNRSSGNIRSAANGQYESSLDIDDALGLGQDLGLGDNPGLATGDGQDGDIPEDVIADTIPDRETLPFTGGPPLFGLALIGLACAGVGFAVLRSAIRRP